MYVAHVALWLKLLNAKQEKWQSGTAMLRAALAMVVRAAIVGQTLVRGAGNTDAKLIKGLRPRT